MPRAATSAIAYAFNHFIAGILREIGTDLVSIVTITLQDNCHVIYPGFGVAENNYLVRGFSLNDLYQGTVFVHTRRKVVNVLGILYVYMVSAKAEESWTV